MYSREDMARAWDEGHAAGFRDLGQGTAPEADNPYCAADYRMPDRVITYPAWCNCGRGNGTPHVGGCSALTEPQGAPFACTCGATGTGLLSGSHLKTCPAVR